MTVTKAPPAPVVLPALKQRLSPNRSSRRGAKPTLLVWHETAGAYTGAVSWLCQPTVYDARGDVVSGPSASAHFVIREDGKEATQLVPIAEKAWHAEAFNAHSIGIEHANTTAKGYATEAQLRVSARVFGFLCLRYGIPPRRSRNGSTPGICRHSDLGALGGGHTQCGMGDADFERYLVMVTEEIERGDYVKTWCK